MLLVQLTVNGSIRYVSIDGHALTHNWMPMVATFDAPQLGIPSDHGGYAAMRYGKISFKPDLFYNAVYTWIDYPPPISCAITIQHSETDEASAETIFTGTAHLVGIKRDEATYSLYGPTYTTQIASGATWNGTLNATLTDILTRIPAITSVNTSLARAVSPNVTYTLSSDVLAIDLASAVAEFYSHLVYVIGSTAYLVDMLLDNGAWTLTEFGFFKEPAYQYKAPIAMISATVTAKQTTNVTSLTINGTPSTISGMPGLETSTTGTYKAVSAYPYGSKTSVTPYHTTQANIEAALADILALENAPRFSVDVPMISGNFPLPGKRITVPDTAHVRALSSWIRARRLKYDFLNSSINIEGEGGIAAA